MQIVWVIVCPILVTMVDNFMPIKFMTGNVFSYKSVLGNKPPWILESMTREKTPTHTRHVEWQYAHPYTKEIRQIEAEFLEASLEFQEIGEQELFDITVDDANHYITVRRISKSKLLR